MDTKTRMKRVAVFGEQYRRENLKGETEDPGSREDPLRLRFLLKRAFAGAKPESLAGKYRKCTETVIRTHEPSIRARWTQSSDGITDNQLRDALEAEGVGNGADREMVIGILDFLGTFPDQDHDVIEYTETKIRAGEVDEMFSELTNIHNIGAKKATLYLRDVVAFLELDDSIARDQCHYLLPIDVWVHRVGSKLGIFDTESPNWRKNSVSIVEHCGSDVSPVAFDQGAWYLGAHAFDVLLDNLDRIEPRSREKRHH